MSWIKGVPRAEHQTERLNRLLCDSYQCDEMITAVATAAQARRKAREIGWQRRPSGDLCPQHGIRLPRGRAARRG